jgi:hypothetical protein
MMAMSPREGWVCCGAGDMVQYCQRIRKVLPHLACFEHPMGLVKDVMLRVDGW